MGPVGLLFIYTCVTLSGAQDVTSVKQISVQRGKSVVIPCFYEQKYVTFKKYLSSGNLSDQRNHHKTVFISDDKPRHVFTVRMDNVQKSGRYWCAIEIPAALDKSTDFFLDVTEDPPGLYVSHQNVTGSESGSVSVTCHHVWHRGVRWCRFGGRCVAGASETLDGASVEIRHGSDFMTVTMSGLKMENRGWYYCSTADLQMPVYISVVPDRALLTPLTPHHITPVQRKRTVVLFLLPVVLEVLLMVIIYSSLKLVRFFRERYSSPAPAEEGQYVTMHRKPSSPTRRCSAAEGDYENMAVVKTNRQRSASGLKSTGPALVQKSDLSNMREADYVKMGDVR